MNHFSLELNRNQPATAQARDHGCAGNECAEQMRCGRPGNDRSDHKRLLISCRTQTFPNPNGLLEKTKALNRYECQSCSISNRFESGKHLSGFRERVERNAVAHCEELVPHRKDVRILMRGVDRLV